MGFRPALQEGLMAEFRRLFPVPARYAVAVEPFGQGPDRSSKLRRQGRNADLVGEVALADGIGDGIKPGLSRGRPLLFPPHRPMAVSLQHHDHDSPLPDVLPNTGSFLH